MLSRWLRVRPPAGPAVDVLNQASYLATVSLLVAVIVFTGSALAVRAGVIHGDPLWAMANHPRPLDAATRAEAGIAPPRPVIAAPVDPGPQPSPDSIDAPPLPTYYQLSRPLHSGTWLPIVMYHYVRKVSKSDTLGWNLSITPDDFRAQVGWLQSHGYTAITMRDADLVLVGQKPMPPKAVVLTFDDGYRDFYTTAAPILREAGFTATEYIPTQLVGGNNYMSWSEIQELDAEGFEIAAHTQFHVDLTKATRDRAKIEVFGSKADLESHLGHPVVDFAYPYGYVSVAVAKLVRDAGFWSATTTQQGAWHDAAQRLYLTRVRMGGTETTVEAIAAGVTEPLPNQVADLPAVPVGGGQGGTSPRR